jgi:hypothetical protein
MDIPKEALYNRLMGLAQYWETFLVRQKYIHGKDDGNNWFGEPPIDFPLFR